MLERFALFVHLNLAALGFLLKFQVFAQQGRPLALTLGLGSLEHGQVSGHGDQICGLLLDQAQEVLIGEIGPKPGVELLELVLGAC